MKLFLCRETHVNLLIPGGHDTRLSVTINCRKLDKIEMDIQFTGDLPPGRIFVILPKTEGKELGKLNGKKGVWIDLDKIGGSKNSSVANIPMRKSSKLVFE